ncbi:MAG: MtN3/saliva family protein [Methanosaeta sp. PtaB.Bin039]|nr:MAG: MtN3/saliva family protein [Methanosaeta sp. PtaB.Bin039]HOT07958.1 SemiSWEET family transporter [Methanotrichaceae archaeon]HQJ29451.1 SemiSWEET family transporter [Methanotrichaceae archaeon]
MSINQWDVVGAAAGMLTMFGFFPQILKMYKTKSVADVSITMMVQYSLGIFLWLLYGLSLANPILIISNGVSLFSFIVGIALYLRYRRVNSDQGRPGKRAVRV